MKKLLSLALALCMILSVGSALAETVALKVWGSQEDQAMLQEMAESFKAANPDKTYDITFGVVGRSGSGRRRVRFRQRPAV
jgi:ABC-type glycerol-3-phosphate transport system substrate-binding protein